MCLDRNGRPQFWPLMRRRGRCWFYSFDLLWMNGRDQRDLPLIERKRRLRAIVPPQPSPLLYASHVDAAGTDLFRAVCEQDLEGIVAKLKAAPYHTEPPSWVKINNPAYSQAIGRQDFFDQARAAAAGRR